MRASPNVSKASFGKPSEKFFFGQEIGFSEKEIGFAGHSTPAANDGKSVEEKFDEQDFCVSIRISIRDLQI